MMQRFTKGLSRDTRPQDQPPGTYVFGKNGFRDLRGVLSNEKGLLPSSAVIPYIPIGLIETDDKPVIFSTDNEFSAIGFFDQDTDSYLPIVNDKDLPYKLGFNTSYYIKGEAQRNYKGDLVVSFTDKHTFPKYMNCTNPDLSSLDAFRLFPLADTPTLDIQQEDGGSLYPGAYYTLVKLLKYDGTETTYITMSDVVIISGTAGTSSGKGLLIKLTDLDPTYDQVQLAFISKTSGVTSAFTMDPVQIGNGNSAIISYTGNNVTYPLTLEEVLIAPAVYSKVATLTQLNDVLYIAGLYRDPEQSMQKYANLVKVRFKSKLISVSPVDPDHASGKIRSFMHQEVYALYIRYSKRGNQGWTPLYALIGTEPTGADLNTSSEGTTGGLTAKKFQVEDTIHSYDVAGKAGECGVWQNATELYPDTEDFNSSDIGGRNLRNQPVLHFRMPSIAWCKSTFYANESEYGRTKLDLLGLEISNVIIPASMTNVLDGGYEIYYAKRTPGNSTVVGQSLLLHGGRKANNSYVINSPDANYLTTGGNWGAMMDFSGTGRERPIGVDRQLLRFHSFDMLYNRPQVSPAFIAPQLKFRRLNIPATGGMIEDFTFDGGRANAPVVYLIDYMEKGTPPTVVGAGNRIRKISNGQYVPNNLSSGKWNNQLAETAYGANIAGSPLIQPSELSTHRIFTGAAAMRPQDAVQSETTFLTNLMNLPQSLYLPFNAQPTVRAGIRATGTQTFWGGDTFVSEYTFHTYGWHDSEDDGYSPQGSGAHKEFGGIRVVRRTIVESASNIYARFEVPGNVYSKWYPHDPLVPNEPTNYVSLFSRKSDPNQFGYNRDSNAVNDLISADIFNPFKEQITDFPFRIHRGGKLNRQLKRKSWRTFIPLDFYEMQKDKGPIVNLEGMDDMLLIHCRNALFYTQDKAKLNQTGVDITLGTGDIFQFEPQEALPSKLGYGGTQHDLACVKTPAGYVFLDARTGQIFIFKKELKLMNELLNRFLEEHTKVKENNVFTGNGVTIGYDPEYKRILFSLKRQVPRDDVPVRDWEPTPEFVQSLVPGISLVRKDGRIQRFLGLNTTAYNCPSPAPIDVPNITVTIPETTPVGTIIATVIGASVKPISYYIMTGNTDNTFELEAATGKLKVVNSGGIDYDQGRTQLILHCIGVNTDGISDPFTITVNITQINEPPVSGDQQFDILENYTNSQLVGYVTAQDPEQAPLTYAIISGNEDGTFAINGTNGAITIADADDLSAMDRPMYLLGVSVSDGTHVVNINVTINVAEVEEPPVLNSASINIDDTLPSGAEVFKFTAVDPDGNIARYEIVNESHPGEFELNPFTGSLTLVDNANLNAQTKPQYTLEVRVIDTADNEATGTLTINVKYDVSTLSFRPGAGACSGACPSGYELTPDGQFCEKFTEVAATPPTGGTPVTVAASTNGAYSNFGILLYAPGYGDNGVGVIQQWINSAPWNNPTNNLINGPLNRCGVWGATTIPDNEPIGFSVPVYLATAKTYYVAVAGDNKCRIAVDGEVIIDQDPNAIRSSIITQLPAFTGNDTSLAFKCWHVYPVHLPAGTHFIGLEGVNFGGAAGFGAEIYDNTPAELLAAQLHPSYVSNPNSFPLNQNHYANLNLVFSTRSARGGTFSSGLSAGYSCPVGFGMDTTNNPPTCVMIERIPGSARVWSTTVVKSLRNNADVQSFINSAGQTFQGIPVPVYPTVNNHVDCGGTQQLFLNTPISVSVQKNNCPDGLGSIVKYSVPGGKYYSLISQADAQAQAQADLDTNKQAYANAIGYCLQ